VNCRCGPSIGGRRGCGGWRRWKAEHDRRLTLDQDGVVKVNYGKFGHPLAEVKAVTGGVKDDE
jgi:hypothetical protein